MRRNHVEARAREKDQTANSNCVAIVYAGQFMGSEQESVTHPYEVGILIFWNSGYTRQGERDGLDQSSGMAGISGLSP
jgi:hypothetical protein